MNILIENILNHNKITPEKYRQIMNKQPLPDFNDVTGIDVFVSRILNAKQNNEKIFVGGDYDADGICATAILTDTLNTLGIENGYYIPHRIIEGYGLHEKTVEKVHEKKYNLIITVDNGVKAHAAIKKCHELGIDILVSDHHTFEERPNCPLLHSFEMGENYRYLSGAGIALAIAFSLGVQKKEHVILAGIALLGDMMSVWESNRTIIQHAIQYLKEGYCLPVQKFKSPHESWNETVISYSVVPKLNAVGRMPEILDTNKMIPFLLSNDVLEINSFYDKINLVNDIRKEKSKQMVNVAEQMIKDYAFPIIHSEHFHEGIVGIIAGKIVNERKLPVAVFSKKGNILKGSFRSIPELNLVEFFEDFKTNFIQFGGHHGAAGAMLSEEKLPLLYEYVNSKKIPIVNLPQPIIVDVACLTVKNVKELEILRPFGVDFEFPIFRVENVFVKQVINLGGKSHYKLLLENDIEILMFNQKNFVKTNLISINFNQITVKKNRGTEIVSIIATN